MDLISLATDFLKTPKGKLLLGEEINIAGITSRIQELSTTYNIDLEELAVSTLEEKTEALTQTKKVDKTLSAKERIKAKSSQLNEDKKNTDFQQSVFFSIVKNYELYRRKYGGQWDILKTNNTDSKEHECVGTFSTIKECKEYLNCSKLFIFFRRNFSILFFI